MTPDGMLESECLFGVSIAHELNQPLAAIVMSAGACSRWLSAQPPNLAKALRALERIANEIRRATEIIGPEEMCLVADMAVMIDGIAREAGSSP